jgi:hypothetical protein
MSDGRRRILDRRAAFIAAITSVGATACDRPKPCLTVTALEFLSPADAAPEAAAADAEAAPAAAGSAPADAARVQADVAALRADATPPAAAPAGM